MTRPQGSATFLKDDNNLLWFALTCRESGIAASRRLKIKDEVLALDIDNAVSLRLLRFDNEKDAANKKFWVGMLGGKTDDDDDDMMLDAEHLGEGVEVW